MTPPNTPPLGLIPAAGLGTRMVPYRAPKELFPFLLKDPTSPGQAVPTPVCMFALRGMKAAGASACLVVISDGKQEVIRDLADGGDVDLPLSYIYQRQPKGLPNVVHTAQPWLSDRDVVFAMPDTVFLPQDALAILHSQRRAQGLELMLGLFLAPEPERLGAVELGEQDTVIHIHDKPGHRRWPWVWGLLAWSGAFTRHCCEWEAERQRSRPATEGVLGHTMEAARMGGMKVGALKFAHGAFLDVGTGAGLAAAVDALAAHGLLYEAKK